jgi:hypothetical protein
VAPPGRKRDSRRMESLVAANAQADDEENAAVVAPLWLRNIIANTPTLGEKRDDEITVEGPSKPIHTRAVSAVGVHGWRKGKEGRAWTQVCLPPCLPHCVPLTVPPSLFLGGGAGRQGSSRRTFTTTRSQSRTPTFHTPPTPQLVDTASWKPTERGAQAAERGAVPLLFSQHAPSGPLTRHRTTAEPGLKLPSSGLEWEAVVYGVGAAWIHPPRP